MNQTPEATKKIVSVFPMHLPLAIFTYKLKLN